MKRRVVVAAGVAAAAALSYAPLTMASAAVGGDHTSGSPGLYNPRDQLRAHTGVSCHYNANGTLRSVSVITPRVKPLRIYTSTHRKSYVKWAAQVQQKSHGKWVAVGRWHKAPEKLLTAQYTWQTLKPLAAITVSGAKVNAAYRVRERIQWKDYNSHTALVGSVVHVMGAYYYGPHTAVTTSCHDHRPTVTSFTTSVLAGKTLTLDLLRHAKDADHDALRLRVLSATKNGAPTTVGAQQNGSVTVATEQSDAGQIVSVRWVAIDAAGVRSPPATLTVNIHGQVPGPPSNVSVMDVQIPAHPDSGDPTPVTADLSWNAPTSGGAPDCYDVRAVVLVTQNDGSTFAPSDVSPTQTMTCVETGTSHQFQNLVPDMEMDSLVLWQVRAVNGTGVSGWTTGTVSPVTNELGQPGPDAFQVLRYSGFWIQSLDNVTPDNCSKNDTVATQTPTSGSKPTGTKITISEYGEVAC